MATLPLEESGESMRRACLAFSVFQSLVDATITRAPSILANCRAKTDPRKRSGRLWRPAQISYSRVGVTLAEGIENELDSAGDPQLFENAIDVIPDGVFLDLQLLSDFAVFQTVGDQANHLFLTARE